MNDRLTFSNSSLDENVKPIEWVNMLIETMECQGAPQNHLSPKRRRSWKKTVLTAYVKVLRILFIFFLGMGSLIFSGSWAVGPADGC